MKCTDKALTYLRRIQGNLLNEVSDLVYVLSVSESVPKGINTANCVAISDNLTAKEVIKLAKASGIGHIIQVSQENFEEELNVSARMIYNRSQFFTEPTRLILGYGNLNKAVNPNNNEMKWQFRALDEKENIKNEIEVHLNTVPRAKHICNAALAVIDELFTNALYHSLEDAPVDINTFDVDHIKYNGDLFAEIFISHSEDRLLVGCKDPSGSLSREKLLKHLWSSYLGDKIQSINMGKGGAGIGCRMIYNHCLGFYAAVKPNVKTMVCATLPLTLSKKFNLDHSKNLHLDI